MKIKGHKDLFNAWKALGESVRALGTIVQNDMDLPDMEYIEWEAVLASTQSKFNAIAKMTIRHCKGIVGPPSPVSDKKESTSYEKEPTAGNEGYLFDED